MPLPRKQIAANIKRRLTGDASDREAGERRVPSRPSPTSLPAIEANTKRRLSEAHLGVSSQLAGAAVTGGPGSLVLLTLDNPPSTNALWRSNQGRVHRSDKYLRWMNDATWSVVSQRKQVQFDGPVRVRIEVERNNRRDLDGYIKPLLDALQHGGLLKNDRQVVALCASWADVTGCVIGVSA